MKNDADTSSNDSDDNDRHDVQTLTEIMKREMIKKLTYRRRTSSSDEDEQPNDGDKDAPGTSVLCRSKKQRRSTEAEDARGSTSEEGNRAESKADDSDTELQTDEGGDLNTDDWTTAEEEEDEEFVLPLVLRKIKPKHTFFAMNEMFQRQIGQSKQFQKRFYGSLHAVEHLERLHTLREHQGCVNTVEFNENGDLLVSGSDDLAVCVWNWATGKKRNSYESGHRNNIFQASWLPRDDLTKMVTCANDGQVRLLDLIQGTTRKLATHYGSCNKFAVHPDTPHVVISVGDDGRVLSVDVRDDKTTRLLKVKENSYRVKLYTIHSNPRNSHEFCVGGHSELVKIFDRRKPSAPITKLCPTKLLDKGRFHITAVTYNYNGTEILASYNDEDIYLFDTLIPHPTGDYAHKYDGHRNSRTIKGVNYFGPKSEFIVSGSDCGNIFFWEKNSEAIVQCVRGDIQGVVNCVKPHPTVPVLASSGLDNDVKIWVPSAKEPARMSQLQECVTSNLKDRAGDRTQGPDLYAGNLFCIILEHFCQNRLLSNLMRRRRLGENFEDDDDDDDDDDEDNNEEEEDDDDDDD